MPMKQFDTLNVWFENRLVGNLWRDNASPAGTGFRYETDWLQGNGFAISQTLPLDTLEYPAKVGGAVQQFFSNLLPEGGARERVVRDLKTPDTDFDLLRAIGGDCAGALSVLPTDRAPNPDYEYSLVSDDQLQKLVKKRGRNLQGISLDNRPRLSLAGAQDKCPVLFQDQHYFLPMQESPSSHILKFEVPDYKNIPLYETFTTLLAQNIGFPTVELEFKTVAKHAYLHIQRYDRYEDEQGKMHRLHQEDLCQAMGYGYRQKYEEDGGPTFAQCFDMIRRVSTDPVIDTQSLLKWQIFNVLAGNSDGHAKNLSLLYPAEQQTRLAPFYDLLCTRAITRIDDHMAFSVGGERNPNRIRLEHWAKEAVNCGIRPAYLQGLVRDSVQSLLSALPIVNEQFAARYGEHPALQRVEKIILGQCKRALQGSSG